MASPTVSQTDGRALRGDRTRRHILDLTVGRASAQGLDGLSIADLARRLEMSKSGLFAAFGSKQELQAATVDHARQLFEERVVRTGLLAPRGLPRVQALCDAWLSWALDSAARGGCFFANVSAEFDAKPGPIRDLIARAMRDWLATLAIAARKAQEQGHLDPQLDPEQLAFELNALAFGANWTWQLFRDPKAFDRASIAIRDRLAAHATPAGLRATSRLEEPPKRTRLPAHPRPRPRTRA